MKPSFVILTGLIVIPLLAGCTIHLPNAYTPTCFRTTCTADAASPDARYMLSTYGVHQFTLDTDEAVSYRPQIEGNLVIWQSGPLINNGAKDLILGFDLRNGKLFNVSETNDVIHSEAYLAHQKVVYKSQPANDQLAYTGNSWLTIWDAKSGHRQQIETGLNGSDDSWGFDGTWLLFAHRFSPIPAENALWAMNLDTGQKDRLYVPVPHGKEHNGTWEELADGNTVADGHAYYAVNNITFLSENQTHTVVTLYDVDLATNETRAVLSSSENHFVRMAVSGDTLVFESNLVARFVNLTTGAVTPFSLANHNWAGEPSIAGDWAFYNAEPDPHSAFRVVYGTNLVTGATVKFDGSQTREVTFDQPNTDGHKIVMVGRFGGDNAEKGGTNLYWADLP